MRLATLSYSVTCPPAGYEKHVLSPPHANVDYCLPVSVWRDTEGFYYARRTHTLKEKRGPFFFWTETLPPIFPHIETNYSIVTVYYFSWISKPCDIIWRGVGTEEMNKISTLCNEGDGEGLKTRERSKWINTRAHTKGRKNADGKMPLTLPVARWHTHIRRLPPSSLSDPFETVCT